LPDAGPLPRRRLAPYAFAIRGRESAGRFASQLPKGPGYEQYDKFLGFPFLTQMDGEQHARLRRLLMPAFSSRRIAQMESSIAGIVEAARPSARPRSLTT